MSFNVLRVFHSELRTAQQAPDQTRPNSVSATRTPAHRHHCSLSLHPCFILRLLFHSFDPTLCRSLTAFVASPLRLPLLLTSSNFNNTSSLLPLHLHLRTTSLSLALRFGAPGLIAWSRRTNRSRSRSRGVPSSGTRRSLARFASRRNCLLTLWMSLQRYAIPSNPLL